MDGTEIKGTEKVRERERKWEKEREGERDESREIRGEILVLLVGINLKISAKEEEDSEGKKIVSGFFLNNFYSLLCVMEK